MNRIISNLEAATIFHLFSFVQKQPHYQQFSMTSLRIKLYR